MRSIFCALITGAAAIPSTCTFTFDNQFDKVLVDGIDATALVVGVFTDWQSSKTLSFADSATDLTVCGSDLIAIDRAAGAFWCPDGDMTACAGFALSCSGGRWNGVATDTTWLVTARGTDPSALVPDANSETLAVASTSPFAWGAAGDKIWSAAADEAACFTKVIAPDLPNDWWVTHFAEGKIPSGHNKVPPEGYEPIDGAGPCRCRGSGTNLDSCGDTVNGDPAAGEGTLCCDGSPYTNPNPGAAGLTSGANRFYIGDAPNGQICYKPIGPEDAPIGSEDAAEDAPIGSEDAPIGSEDAAEDAPIGSDNGNNPSPRPTAGPAPRPADSCTAEEAARETAEAALVSAQAERDAAEAARELAEAALVSAQAERDAEESARLAAEAALTVAKRERDAAMAARDTAETRATQCESGQTISTGAIDVSWCLWQKEGESLTISTDLVTLDEYTVDTKVVDYHDPTSQPWHPEYVPHVPALKPIAFLSATHPGDDLSVGYWEPNSQMPVSLTLTANKNLANIDALSSLTSIGGSLTISNNPVLANLDGLRNLREVARGNARGNVVIQDNPGLTTLTLNNLREMGGTSLTIKDNRALRTISFPSLTKLGFQGVDGSYNGFFYKREWTMNGGGNFVIEGCSSLETISAPVLRQIGHSLIIQDNGDYALNEGSVFSLEKIGAYVTRAHYQSITKFTEFGDQVEQGPLYSYPPATCTGLDFLGLSACPTCEQEWDLTACAQPGTLCGVLVCKGSSGSGNKSSGGNVAASTSYIIVIVILAVLLFASLCYIIVKQRAERAAPHSRKSMPTISEA